MTQEKNGVSALELSRELGISYNATWRLKHKLMQAMKERDDEQGESMNVCFFTRCCISSQNDLFQIVCTDLVIT